MTEESEHKFLLLHRNIKHADLAAIQNALEAGVTANLENKHGYSLLMLVAVEGSVAIGELLISKGANINQVTPHGTSAVSLAVIRGHVRFLKFLLENGADANAILNGVPIEKWIPSCLFGPKKEAAMLALLDEYRVRISN